MEPDLQHELAVWKQGEFLNDEDRDDLLMKISVSEGGVWRAVFFAAVWEARLTQAEVEQCLQGAQDFSMWPMKVLADILDEKVASFR